jgi:hypothetical protein
MAQKRKPSVRKLQRAYIKTPETGGSFAVLESIYINAANIAFNILHEFVQSNVFLHITMVTILALVPVASQLW